MKFNYKNLSLILLLITLVFGCKEEEMKYIDPMIDGVSEKVDMDVNSIIGNAWNNALIDLRAKKLKLLTIKKLIETGAYSGDNYGLENETVASTRVAESLQKVEFKLDSIWDASIQNTFDAINPNSEGIKQLGQASYNATALQVDAAFMWVMSENNDDYAPWASNELADLQLSLAPLTNLSSLNDQEVIQFVNDVKNKFAEMQTQYADLASEMTSNPHMPKAHKELYASLETPMTEMAGTIENALSLDTKAAVDAIDWDLSALVYFVANNNTSPVRKPKVWGEISNIMELRWLSEEATESELNGNWVLTADIDAVETERWNLDEELGQYGFKPITTPTSINFDGQFHIISGLYLSKIGGAGDAERSGLFAKLVNGSVHNLGLVNLRMDATRGGNGNQGGTLVGFITGSGSVTKCFTHGTFDKLGSQSGGFIGRPQVMTGEISDCFSAVACRNSVNPHTSSFIGLPVAGVNIFNCYNLGHCEGNIRAIMGHGSGCSLNASGLYYDSATCGTTNTDNGAFYSADTPVKLSDPGVLTDVPTANWGDLANFPGFSADTWEIKTVSEIDPNPRPYLKGFNYGVLEDMLPVTPLF